jgi:hypothetical protein
VLAQQVQIQYFPQSLLMVAVVVELGKIALQQAVVQVVVVKAILLPQAAHQQAIKVTQVEQVKSHAIMRVVAVAVQVVLVLLALVQLPLAEMVGQAFRLLFQELPLHTQAAVVVALTELQLAQLLEQDKQVAAMVALDTVQI